jgi:hypothetical protein
LEVEVGKAGAFHRILLNHAGTVNQNIQSASSSLQVLHERLESVFNSQIDLEFGHR